MLAKREELDLRHRVSDLLLNWHSEQRGAIESARPEDYLDFIEASAAIADESNLSLQRWALAARREGLTWEQIGTALGVSRQAAQKRFSPSPVGQSEPTEGLIVRKGVTAFNEVQVLKDEGLLGRRVVGAGWAKLYFQPTDQVHENVRLVSLSRGKPISEMEAEGWTHAFSWYPYTYYTRAIST